MWLKYTWNCRWDWNCDKKALPLAMHNRHRFQPGREGAVERSSASNSLSQRRCHVCLIKKIDFSSYSGFIIIYGNGSLKYNQETPLCSFCWFWGKGVTNKPMSCLNLRLILSIWLCVNAASQYGTLLHMWSCLCLSQVEARAKFCSLWRVTCWQ